MPAFVCVVEAHLHFGESQDLKGKRKLVKSLKDQIRQRFGAAVAETDGHDKWQRTTLVCALVGESDVGDRADGHGALHREPLSRTAAPSSATCSASRTFAASGHAGSGSGAA